ncbi:Zn-dependent exopeptidase [Athelia psychrophila]|uniref:Peptide hydrolase n=1 Tax=Athelia psychrophila TaxID=1759441 RepID=A0A166DBY6_9AGAM|nr:Zn-dependent exopeptidase [Fibularhizoctonia sp. CBS 109695]
MRTNFACILSTLSLACLLSLILAQEVPLALQSDHTASPLSLLTPPGVSAVDGVSNFIMNSMSPSQREEIMLKLWEQQDVVEVMKMTGHGAGLDEQRILDVFGQGVMIASEGDKLRLKKDGYSFMDITDHQDLGELNKQRLRTAAVSPTLTINAKSTVDAMTAELNTRHLREDLEVLSSFWTRNYYTHWGLRSSNWIHDQVEKVLATSPTAAVKTSVSKFSHVFLQNTIIARLERSDDTSEDKQIIILSAHQDSLNYLLPFYRAPGADDDGSGSVTILQVLRSLIEQSFVPPPNIAVEFHWFAAEEGGLLGSQAVASAYEKADKTVKGMLHMDMTAFVKKGSKPIIGFFDSQVNANLTTFATQLVESYIPLSWGYTGCGASCGSDHMSFNKAGFPVAFATEGLFEDGPQNIHTAGDDMDNDGQFSLDHMLEFVKLGIAFVAELAASP